MPLIRHEGRVALFVHIPKTGGTSVENAMTASGASVALRFGKRFDGFIRTTFQHLHAEIYSSIIPADFYDYAFATVRHPVSRLISEYFYRRRRAGERIPFDTWVHKSLDQHARSADVMDNHIRPQVDFLIDGVATFRIEDGIDKPLIAAAAQLGLTLAETDTHSNKRRKKNPVTWTNATRERVLSFYDADFDTFAYDRDQDFPDLSIQSPRLRLF